MQKPFWQYTSTSSRTAIGWRWHTTITTHGRWSYEMYEWKTVANTCAKWIPIQWKCKWVLDLLLLLYLLYTPFRVFEENLNWRFINCIDCFYFIDCIFGGGNSTWYNLWRNIRRYDGARGKLSEIGVQSAWLSKTKNHMVGAILCVCVCVCWRPLDTENSIPIYLPQASWRWQRNYCTQWIAWQEQR